MSDTVIMGMGMPKSCLDEKSVNDCPIVGICQIYKNTPYPEKRDIFFEQRLTGCPLKELPPHGRLGDLDKLYFAVKSEFCDKCKKSQHGVKCPECKVNGFLAKIVFAPTILEASEC